MGKLIAKDLEIVSIRRVEKESLNLPNLTAQDFEIEKLHWQAEQIKAIQMYI